MSRADPARLTRTITRSAAGTAQHTVAALGAPVSVFWRRGLPVLFGARVAAPLCEPVEGPPGAARVTLLCRVRFGAAVKPRPVNRMSFREGKEEPRARDWDCLPEENRRYALIMVDPQNDFCPGGALAVNKGDEVIPMLLQLHACRRWAAIFMTQDWHPRDHASFARVNGKPLFSLHVLDKPEPGTEQVMWPDHCVQGTAGAEFQPALLEGLEAQGLEPDVAHVIRKGTREDVDSYSGFGDAFRGAYERTELAGRLDALCITHVVIAGLALDYCVAYTALDAARQGTPDLAVAVVLDGCRAIDQNGSLRKALTDMERMNVLLVRGVADLAGGGAFDWRTLQGLSAADT